MEVVIQREIESVEMEIENRGQERPPNNALQTLPEPLHPPFNQQPIKADDEPIYEAVLPRDEDNASPPPLPTPPHKLIRTKSPIIVAVESTGHRSTSPAAILLSPRQSRPSSRNSGTGVRQLKLIFNKTISAHP